MKTDHEKQIDLIRTHAASWLKNSKAGALHYGITESEYKDLAWTSIIHRILHGPTAPPPEVLADDESCLSYLAMVLCVQKTDVHLLYTFYLQTYRMHSKCFVQLECDVAERYSAESGIETSNNIQ